MPACALPFVVGLYVGVAVGVFLMCIVAFNRRPPE